MMNSSFELYIPESLTFQDFLAVTQTARAWADGYDLKSYAHLISTLASQVVIDYSDVNPAWGRKTYPKKEFADLWLSKEHLGNPAMNTQHLLGMPYFSYVGPLRLNTDNSAGQQDGGDLQGVQEIELTWQILASHARRANTVPQGGEGHMPTIGDTSDHRAFMTQVYFREQDNLGRGRQWKLASIKPSPIYMTGDFARVRRPADDEDL